MLIDYSARAAAALKGPLGRDREEALYADFRRIGEGLGIMELPEWRALRALRLTPAVRRLVVPRAA
jgi:hypothetical protein